MTSQQNRGSTPIERWVQHFVQAISVAAVIGGFLVLTDLRTKVAVMSSEMKSFGKQIEDMRVSSADRYTASRAERDLKGIRDRLDDHENRLRKLEQNWMQRYGERDEKGFR